MLFVRVDATLGLVEKTAEVNMHQRLEKIADVFNGDVRSQRITVHSRGRSRDEVVEEVLSTLLEGGLLLGSVSGTPKKGRWGSRADHDVL